MKPVAEKQFYYQKDNSFFKDAECTIPLKLDGVTAEEWAKEYFEYTRCESCEHDIEAHLIIPFNGHWFAKCLKEDNE